MKVRHIRTIAVHLSVPERCLIVRSAIDTCISDMMQVMLCLDLSTSTATTMTTTTTTTTRTVLAAGFVIWPVTTKAVRSKCHWLPRGRVVETRIIHYGIAEDIHSVLCLFCLLCIMLSESSLRVVLGSRLSEPNVF